MVGYGDMVALTRGADMAYNPLIAKKYFDRLPCDANINFLFDEGIGDKY